MKKALLLGVVGIAGMLAPMAMSTGDRTTICHATKSASNPYVEITISNSALAAHRNHQDREDIIPAPETGCPGEPGDIDTVTVTTTVTTPGTTTTVTTPGQTVTLPGSTQTVTVDRVVTLPAVTVERVVTTPAVTVTTPTRTVTLPGKTVTIKGKVKPKVITRWKESKRCPPAKTPPRRCEGDCSPKKLKEGASG
jgi:hypothetical protein